MNVLVEGGTIIELAAQNRIGVVWGAEANGVCLRENAVAVRGGGCAGEDVDLEFFTSSVSGLRLLCDRNGQGLRVASTGEAGNADAVAVVDELSRFLSGNNEVLIETDTLGQGDSSCGVKPNVSYLEHNSEDLLRV